MWMFTNIPKSTEAITLKIANTHIMELGQWVPMGELQMGLARQAQYGGELAGLAISATNFGQNVMDKALALTVLVSFDAKWLSNTDGE